MLFADTYDYMVGFPEFYYNGKTYVADIDIDYTGIFTEEIYNKMKSLFYNGNYNGIGFKWLEVEDMCYTYIKKYNILMASKAYEVSNFSLKYPNLLAFNLGSRVIGEKVKEPSFLPSVTDSINKSYISTNAEYGDTSCFCTNVYFCSHGQAEESTISYSNLNIIEKILKEKNILDKDDSIDVLDFDPKNQLIIFEYGEYPQEKLEFTNLNESETGKVYHALEVDSTGKEKLISLIEYYDEKHNVRYVKYNGEKYKVSPIEWMLDTKDRKITTRKHLIVNSNGGSNVKSFIIKYFLHDIIPSNIKTDVHDVVKSNIGYQLLINKNNINEADLELDEGNKLVLKRGN